MNPFPLQLRLAKASSEFTGSHVNKLRSAIKTGDYVSMAKLHEQSKAEYMHLLMAEKSPAYRECLGRIMQGILDNRDGDDPKKLLSVDPGRWIASDDGQSSVPIFRLQGDFYTRNFGKWTSRASFPSLPNASEGANMLREVAKIFPSRRAQALYKWLILGPGRDVQSKTITHQIFGHGLWPIYGLMQRLHISSPNANGISIADRFASPSFIDPGRTRSMLDRIINARVECINDISAGRSLINSAITSPTGPVMQKILKDSSKPSIASGFSNNPESADQSLHDIARILFASGRDYHDLWDYGLPQFSNNINHSESESGAPDHVIQALPFFSWWHQHMPTAEGGVRLMETRFSDPQKEAKYREILSHMSRTSQSDAEEKYGKKNVAGALTWKQGILSSPESRSGRPEDAKGMEYYRTPPRSSTDKPTAVLGTQGRSQYGETTEKFGPAGISEIDFPEYEGKYRGAVTGADKPNIFLPEHWESSEVSGKPSAPTGMYRMYVHPSQTPFSMVWHPQDMNSNAHEDRQAGHTSEGTRFRGIGSTVWGSSPIDHKATAAWLRNHGYGQSADPVQTDPQALRNSLRQGALRKANPFPLQLRLVKAAEKEETNTLYEKQQRDGSVTHEGEFGNKAQFQVSFRPANENGDEWKGGEKHPYLIWAGRKNWNSSPAGMEEGKKRQRFHEVLPHVFNELFRHGYRGTNLSFDVLNPGTKQGDWREDYFKDVSSKWNEYIWNKWHRHGEQLPLPMQMKSFMNANPFPLQLRLTKDI